MISKIALEEHFVPAELSELITNPGWDEPSWQRTLDLLADTEQRLKKMDRAEIDVAVLSLGSNGIQDVLEPARAVALATEVNDALAQVVAAHPDRYLGLAALPMLDIDAAVVELDRCVQTLGFKGALVNGYSSHGSLEIGRYYDDPAYDPLWERFAALRVPFYLHPRNPLPTQRRIYEGREQLLGPTWAFGAETAVHALRMLIGGVFDRFPDLTVVLGHLGELLPFAIRRLEQRLSRRSDVNLERPAAEYLRDNFYLTTSGNYHTPSLIGIVLELGVDRLLFAADYPFEELDDAARWLDNVPISERDRRKVASENARALLRLE
jgi:predicted TIM-barrel fold metal-dependent hydrolase